MRFNESGPDIEALPFAESKALSLQWTDHILKMGRFGFGVWEVMEFRSALVQSGREWWKEGQA